MKKELLGKVKVWETFIPRAVEHIQYKLTATGQGAHKTDRKPSRARRKQLERKEVW